jgi:hypothetical protein
MLLKSVEGSEITVDQADELSVGKATAVWAEAMPVERMVPYLGCIVENTARAS